MRFGSYGVGLVMGAALLALAGCSDDEPAVANDSGGAGNGVCLATAQIDHTDIVNDSAIVFFMKDGKAYMNAMRIPCSSLQMEGAFAYETDAPEVCSNSQTIRVKNSGNFCELGQFTPFTPPKVPG
ncbi:MAG TPA: hypothetical protein VH722_20575 [Alphaproteobacteria bacterium]|jgi:hypothetical protein|nr:hypothetical protein [Alphaproteobacteria bacterium]